MVWIYLLQSIPKKMKSKPPPTFSIFLATIWRNNHDLHCALSEKELGSIVSSSLYIGKVATGIVISSCLLLLGRRVMTGSDYVSTPSLLMNSSDGHDDIINARHCGLKPVATDFLKIEIENRLIHSIYYTIQ
jgi:hypothetical protein